MKLKETFAALVLTAFLLAANAIAVKPAFAGPSAELSANKCIFQNTLGSNVNMAVTYYNKAIGRWVTTGWWLVKGNKSASAIMDNADTSKNVYYVGVNGKNIYYDSATLYSDSVNRWIDNGAFWFDNPQSDKPKGKNVRTARFYKCRYSEEAGAYVIRLDTRKAD